MRDDQIASTAGTIGASIARHRSCWCVVLLVVLACCLPAQAIPPEKNVLFLYSFSRRDTFDALEYLKSTVRSQFAGPVNFNVEYLDSTRFCVPGYAKSLSATLRDACSLMIAEPSSSGCEWW